MVSGIDSKQITIDLNQSCEPFKSETKQFSKM